MNTQADGAGKERGGKTVLTICAFMFMVYLVSVGILFSGFHSKFEALKSELKADSAAASYNPYRERAWFERQAEREPEQAELEKGELHYANQDSPGEIIDLPNLIKIGKTNIIFFESPHCPTCQQMLPTMEKLAVKQTDFNICVVNIDRKSSNNIDYDSPVAQQFDIHSVPKYRLYDYRGKFISTDDDAKKKVRVWIRQAYLD
jgi:thiol-disulfide isomerase/thioredoxin